MAKYERLPGGGENGRGSSSAFASLKGKWRSPSPGSDRLRFLRLSPLRLLIIIATILFGVALLAGGKYKPRVGSTYAGSMDDDDIVEPDRSDRGPQFTWQNFNRLNGYYNGVRKLIPVSEWVPENPLNETQEIAKDLFGKAKRSLINLNTPNTDPPMEPVVFSPYPDYESYEYLSQHRPVEKCYLDANDKIAAPDIYAYPGIPEGMTTNTFGSPAEIGFDTNVCFDRFGRFVPYGYGYYPVEGGLGLGNRSEKGGVDKIFDKSGKIDYRGINWGDAQKKCFEKNKLRFENSTTDDQGKAMDTPKKKVSRTAYVLRTWTGNKYDEHQIMTIRAMINELSLKSGGEYDIHFLVHVKDDSIPIWASDEVYRETLEANVPEEFWGMATLWSEKLMELYYPDPFPDNVVNMAGAPIHGVYRSAHFALQWFAQQHQEYDFFWNWEMDVRLSGHYYEFHNKISDWAREQPRKGLWERSSRFYIPEVHGAWANFTETVERESKQAGITPIWGPVEFPATDMLDSPPEVHPPRRYQDDDYEWGVGEDADLIVFDPIFDPERSNWVFRLDVTGYNLSLPVPPRRCAIITIGRLSKRLLNLMHEETWAMRHTMFPEMWPPSVALHHGLKAVYAPHPVFFDRDWPLEYADQIFNHPETDFDSVFGWGEHNFLGTSFYYNSGFSGALWRRFLGQRENNEGGMYEEGSGTGRMCLRNTLFHPIKHEHGSTD
ncbi:hypothetical protein EV356DRAFT_443365 [Viridothelium virens]|uniref:Uncharacterized protein n=1 Tax=Viridothelium virens TaxID=1048519 RepID=A0A6A6HFX5_VIRVR|nr:hypothetical protein EV356DRAFT_443365 [Viridothelium virens]